MFLARRFVWRCRSDQKEYLTVLASENRTKVEVAEVRFLGFVSFPWPLTPTWQPNRFADSTKTWGNDAGADLVYFYTQLVLVSSRNASPRKRLLRIEPHSFRAVNQLEFSSHFLEGVRATFAVRWLVQSQLCFYRCCMSEWQNNQNRHVKTSHQLEQCCRSPIQNVWDKQQPQASRANCGGGALRDDPKNGCVAD